MRESIAQSQRKRLPLNSIMFLLFWVATLAMIMLNAPFWSILLASLAGTYFALKDWRIVRAKARERILPMPPDTDVQALVDEKIDIAEYRRRKEGAESV